MPNTREYGYDKISFARGTDAEVRASVDKLEPYEPVIATDTGKFMFKDENGSLKSFSIGGDTQLDLDKKTDKGGYSGTANDLKSLIDNLKTATDSHANNTSNPHRVTKSQVGLGNVGDYAAVNKAGDTITGTLTMNGGGRIDFLPSNGVSVIDFKNTGSNNDRGWIKHFNSSSTANMQFVVSDDPDGGDDYFTFGAASGNANNTSDGTYVEWLKITRSNAYYRGNAIYHTGYKPSAGDVGALPISGGKMTGIINISDHGVEVSKYGGGGGLYAGKGDAASSTTTNVQLRSWYGIGFSPSISGQAIPQYENACYMNVRSGDFTARGNVTAYSDGRLKKDLDVIPDALNKIEALTGYTYTRTDSGERHTGLIAQDVEKVLPEAVQKQSSELGDDTLALAYGNMVGLLVEGIKELRREVEDLKARLGEYDD